MIAQRLHFPERDTGRVSTPTGMAEGRRVHRVSRLKTPERSGSNIKEGVGSSMRSYSEDSYTQGSNLVIQELRNQLVSQSCCHVARQKFLALKVAINEAERTRMHAEALISEKVVIAAKLQDDHRLYVRAARADLKQHILNSRVSADERTKKRTMVLSQVRNNISNAQTFASQMVAASDAATTTMRYSADLPNGQVGQTLSGTNHDEIEAAMKQTQMRMLMQQQRLRSARLEVIECLTEQQKIEAEMRALRSLVAKGGQSMKMASREDPFESRSPLSPPLPRNMSASRIRTADQNNEKQKASVRRKHIEHAHEKVNQAKGEEEEEEELREALPQVQQVIVSSKHTHVII
jgi:hypothetical protein